MRCLWCVAVSVVLPDGGEVRGRREELGLGLNDRPRRRGRKVDRLVRVGRIVAHCVRRVGSSVGRRPIAQVVDGTRAPRA